MDDKNKILEDMESINLGNLNTIEFDLVLPRMGEHGSMISWISSDTRFLKRNGKVIQPRHGMGKRVVTLTGVFELGSYKMTKEYTVTIMEENDSFEVRDLMPIIVHAQVNETFYLPNSAVITTANDLKLSHTIDWEGKEACCFEEPGIYQIRGHLLQSNFPVSAKIIVHRTYQKPLLYKERNCISCEGNVALLPSSFLQAMRRKVDALCEIDDDQMLYNFRMNAQLDLHNAQPMIGWDTVDSKLRGHTTGHYLSALALCYRETKEKKILNKIQYMIEELGKCQDAISHIEGYHEGYLGGIEESQYDALENFAHYPEIWAPYYSLHKILAGLLDCYQYTYIEKAKQIAERLGKWVVNRLSDIDKASLKRMWGIYIAGEYGGMNESLAQLYQLTGDIRFLQTAMKFDNDRLMVPLQQDVDALCWIHVNQHIPQVVGALKIFEGSHQEKYYTIAKRFWDFVVEAHTYTNGSIGEGEIFHEPYAIASMIDDNTGETCASYNMLKLTKELFSYEPKVKYMDYYERCMVNHILATQIQDIPEASTYFFPLEPGSKKSYTDENSCCHGTGLENHFKYSEAIYFANKDDVYINLFVSSVLNFDKQDVSVDMKVKEECPEDIHIKFIGAKKCKLHIRVPYWHRGDILVTINGVLQKTIIEDGYIVMDQLWENTEIHVQYHCSYFIEETPDRSDIISIHYGPYVLAVISQSQEYIQYQIQDIEKQISKQPQELKFYDLVNRVELLPLFQIDQHSYHVYVKKG